MEDENHLETFDSEEVFLNFFEEMVEKVDMDDYVWMKYGKDVFLTAFTNGFLVPRPMHASRTSPYYRRFVPSPQHKLEVERVINELQFGSLGNDPTFVTKSIAYLSNFYMMPTPERVSRSRIPCFTSIDAALAYFEDDHSLFSDMFGWYPEMVEELCFECENFIPKFRESRVYSTEERILCVLARFKLGVSSWSMLAFQFKRWASQMCTMFKQTVSWLLERFGYLLSLEGIYRMPSSYPDIAGEKFLAKYRKFTRNPRSELPDEFKDINAMMDGSHFTICRPGGDNDADVQRSFYTNYKKSHTINALFIVLVNGIRVYCGVASGRHADPFLFNEEVKETCKKNGLVLLCDAIFPASDICKPMPGFDDNHDLSPADCIRASALRIPVEWSMLMTQDYPLLNCPAKLKIFHTSPVSLIEMGTLLANFKLCIQGENITTSFGIRPPTLREYMNGNVI